MLWVIPAWIGSVIFMFWLGFYIRGLAKKLKEVTMAVEKTLTPKPTQPEPPSTLIDPLDPIAEAKWQHDEMMRRLNGPHSTNSQR